MTDNEISKLVRANIQTKIIEAFKSTPEMIEQLVSACLSSDVDQFGNKPGYNDKKMPYLTYLAQDSIQRVAREAVQEYIKTMAPVIKNQVKSKLSAGKFVDALSCAIIDSTKNLYDVKIEFNQKDEDGN